MIDKSKRYLKTRMALDTLSILEGRRINFDSMAEMIMTRAQEIPDKVHVLFYDEVITYAQTNERANQGGQLSQRKRREERRHLLGDGLELA